MKAILTGHTRGLGAAIAEELLARGIPLLAVGRRLDAVLAERYPGLLKQAKVDLSDTVALTAWLAEDELGAFLGDTGSLVLINNAGTLGPVGPLATQGLADIGRAVSLNVTAPLAMSSALASRHQGELRILHVSSGAARNAFAGWSVYGATKAALDQHARAVALDGRRNLKICSMAPGVVDTDMQAEIRGASSERFPLLANFQALKQEGKLSTPQAAASKLVAYLIGEQFGTASIADLREIP